MSIKRTCAISRRSFVCCSSAIAANFRCLAQALHIIVSARAQASEFANQAPVRIVEQPRGSRTIYEDETVFELAPGFCANCIRASLLAGPGPPDFPFRLLGHRYHSRRGLDRARHGRIGGADRARAWR